MCNAKELHNKIRTEVADHHTTNLKPVSAIYVGFSEWNILTKIENRHAFIKSWRQPDGRMSISCLGIPVYRVVSESHLEVA